MRVLRRAAVQAHAVPETAGYPRGPFGPDILAKPVVVHEDVSDTPFPMGATAQNDYRGIRYFRCKNCLDVVADHEVDAHICGVARGED